MEISDEDRQHGRNFSTETKNMLVLREIIEAAPRCGFCGARLLLRSVSIDHKIRRADGGVGAPEMANSLIRTAMVATKKASEQSLGFPGTLTAVRP